MDKLERFKQLSDSMPMQQKIELHQQFVNPEAGINSLITLAAGHGLELTQAEVSELIKSVDVEDKFNDVEPDNVALSDVSGRSGDRHEPVH